MTENTNVRISNDCGALALIGACKMLGKNVTYNQIIELVKPQREGVSMLTLKHAAEHIGLQTHLVRTNYINLCSLTKPVIVHLRWNHFDVVSYCDAHTVEFKGRSIWNRIPFWLFKLEWSGAVMILSLK